MLGHNHCFFSSQVIYEKEFSAAQPKGRKRGLLRHWSLPDYVSLKDILSRKFTALNTGQLFNAPARGKGLTRKRRKGSRSENKRVSD